MRLVAYQESRLKDIFDAWKQEGAHVPITVRNYTIIYDACSFSKFSLNSKHFLNTLLA